MNEPELRGIVQNDGDISCPACNRIFKAPYSDKDIMLQMVDKIEMLESEIKEIKEDLLL